jgi:hypothetical protein
LVLLIVVVLAFMAQPEAQQAMPGGNIFNSIFPSLCGAYFLAVGIESVRRRNRETLLHLTLFSCIGSIVIGLLNLAEGSVQAANGQVLQGRVSILAGAGLIAAGVLALVSGSQHKV